jgi:hypothetical protein
VYDFVFDTGRGKWVPWMDTLESKALDPEAEYSTIIVPTVDTVRYTYLLDKLVTHGLHVLLVGPTGLCVWGGRQGGGGGEGVLVACGVAVIRHMNEKEQSGGRVQSTRSNGSPL